MVLQVPVGPEALVAMVALERQIAYEKIEPKFRKDLFNKLENISMKA